MSINRWLGAVLVTSVALAGCAEQGGEQAAESEMMETEPATEQAMEAPTGDTTSADLAVWNTDADARLAADEFSAWLEEQDFYGQWNTDGAEGLTPAELAAGLTAVMDRKDDGAISSMEWTESGASWTAEGTTFADWDANGDDTIRPNEAAAGLEAGTLWGQWDQDGNGVLSRSEFDAAVFAAWDTNGDGFVDETEWGANYDLWS